MRQGFLFLTIATLSVGCYADTLVVDPNGDGDYFTIQSAIIAARDGDTVLINKGIYTGEGNRNIDFKGRAITVRSTDPNNPATVAATVIDCQNIHRGFVFFREESSSSILSGLTIKNGYSGHTGGAILIFHSNPTIEYCRMTNSYADDYGGAIAINSCNPIIKHCQIINNHASTGGGIDSRYSSPTIYNCTVDDNKGGGIWFVESNAIMTDCIISDNSDGSGIKCTRSDLSITNSVIQKNHSEGMGGGFYFFQCDNPQVINCLIAGNTSYGASAMYMVEGHPKIKNCTIVENDEWRGFGTIYCNNQEGGTGTITNSIIWDNYDGEAIRGNVHTSFCNIKDDYPGEGNLNTDPLFIEPSMGNYHLSATSPCINTGNPAGDYNGLTDIDGESRVIMGRIDIGFDEFSNPQDQYIGVSPFKMSFSATEGGANPKEQVLRITNVGTKILNWQILEDCSWLNATPISGVSSGQENEIVVNVDITSLNFGSYDCQLLISSTDAINSPIIVNVGLDIQVPIIEISKNGCIYETYYGNGNPDDQSFTIRNSGVEILDWSISYDCDWLTINPISGRSNGEENVVNLSVETAGLIPDSYNCDLTIVSPWASNSPQVVSIVLDVYEPIIEIAPFCIEFIAPGGQRDPNDQIMNIRNSGTGILSWTIVEDCTWLEVHPTNGNSTELFDEVILSADVNGLTPGIYQYSLNVIDNNAPNSPYIIPITLHVSEPYLEPTTRDLDFFANINNSSPSDQILLIMNAGGGSLLWEISENCSWLQASPSNGITDSETDEVIITVDANNLNTGNYDYEITIESPNATNGSQKVLVSLYVLKPYKITNLGTLDTYSTAYGINDYGYVVGYSGNNAFFYDGESMYGLGTLGGDLSSAKDINNNGHVIGYSRTGPGLPQHAFLYDGTTMHDLGSLGGSCWAYGVNDNGKVVGVSYVSSYRSGFLYDGTAMYNLSELCGAYVYAYDINNKDQIVGSQWVLGGETSHAFLYDGTKVHDLGTLGGTESSANGINEIGQVVGTSEITGDIAVHGFFFDGEIMHDLGTLGGTFSNAEAINDKGQIIGISRTAGDISLRPYLYDGEKMIDLDDFLPANNNWELKYAYDINNSGQIVGQGIIDGENRAFLMTPVLPNFNPVALAGEDKIAYAFDDGYADVQLDGTRSYDEDGDVLEYSWYDGNELIATGAEPNVMLPVGEHVIDLIVNDGAEDSEPDSVVITVIEAVKVSMNLTPGKLNCRSRGDWVIAHILLPEEYSIADVDPNKPVVVDSYGIESALLEVDFNKKEKCEGVTAFFDRESICNLAGDWPEVFRIYGFFTDGRVFFGEAGIRINPAGLKEVSELASYWMGTCESPKWCDGLDLNRDSMVDMQDYSLLLNSEVEFTSE